MHHGSILQIKYESKKDKIKCSSLNHKNNQSSAVCSHLLHLDAALHFIKCLSELKPCCCSLCLLEGEVSICHPVFRVSRKSINLVELFCCQHQHKHGEGWWWDLSAWPQCVISGHRNTVSLPRPQEVWLSVESCHTQYVYMCVSMCERAKVCIFICMYKRMQFFKLAGRGVKESSSQNSVTVYEVWPDEL